MTREAPKQQGNCTRENIKKAVMTDSSASSDRRRRVFTIHQRSQGLERFQEFLLKDGLFLTTVSVFLFCLETWLTQCFLLISKQIDRMM